MKRCIRCEQEKIELAFGTNRREKDGLNKVCRECHAAYNVRYTNQKKMKSLLKYRPEWAKD